MATVRKRQWTSAKGAEKTAYIVDFYDNNGNRQRKQFSRFKIAEKFRVKMEGQVADGTHRPDAAKVTVSEACKLFLAHCQGRMDRDERMTRKMFVVYQGHVNNHILNPEHGVGHLTLARLTKKSVGDFRDLLRASGVSVPTTRKVLSTLHGMLEHAASQELVAVNAAHGVRVIASRDEGTRKIVAPSKEDARRVLEAAGKDRLPILFAAATGLRAGEQWALRWADADLSTGTLHVSRRIDVYGEEGPPKTAAGIRQIPLSKQLVKELRAHKAASGYSKADDFVFANRKGGHTRHDNFIKRHFLPIFSQLEKAHDDDPDGTPKAPGRFNWHTLRHFAVSTWIEAGLAPKTVQTFAGHSSLQVTMDRYGHLFPSDDHREAMDAISGELVV